VEFSFPWVRWLIKSWFWISALFFLYLFWIDIFVHRWFILLWAVFSAGLGAYVAPAIRVEPRGLHVKYLWRYRWIPWNRVLDVHRTLLGAQILTIEPNWAYRVVGYQYPMPGVRQLVRAVGEGLERSPPRKGA
jgi:hypothetical protein